jgi:hypothetical protein
MPSPPGFPWLGSKSVRKRGFHLLTTHTLSSPSTVSPHGASSPPTSRYALIFTPFGLESSGAIRYTVLSPPDASQAFPLQSLVIWCWLHASPAGYANRTGWAVTVEG